MKYYTITEPVTDEQDQYQTLTEDDIIDLYWDEWADAKIEKYGQEYFDLTFSIHECVEDWCMLNRARAS